MDGRIEWVAVGVGFKKLRHRHGQGVLRVKGSVEAEDYGWVSVNSIQHVISPPEHLELERKSGTSRLVMILHNLPSNAVAASVRGFQALS